MIQKIKSIISALAVAIVLAAGSAMIGQPLPTAESSNPVASQELDASDADQLESAETRASEPLVRLKSRVVLSMPYYSFGSLLPRTRGS